MVRYGFNIKTRTGQRVDNISIMAGSQADAERRLRQMYLHCEILERSVMQPAMMTPSMPAPAAASDGSTFEEIVSLISK